MNGYNLTDGQKELLRKLVKHKRAGELYEPILPHSELGEEAGTFREYIHLRGKPPLEHRGDLVGDLDALCDADLMGFRWSKKGDKLYSIKQAGYDAVDSNFEVPSPYAGAQYNIGAIVQSMSGGSIQAVGLADNAEISQVVNDPALLRAQVETLAEKLLDEVKAALAGKDLIEYAQAIQDFKEELLAEEPNPSLLKRLTITLALLGDIEGTIGLMIRVWPYLYPLLLIAAEKLA